MGRPWVKLYVSFLDHPAIGRLDDRTRLIFVELLLVAARTGDDGHIGTVDDAAWATRRTPTQIRAAIAKLDGRITDVDGHLCVRDWAEHQAAQRKAEPAEQVTERTRRFKERARERGGNAVVPAGGTMKERGGNAALELEEELEVEAEPENNSPPAPPARPPTAPPPAVPAGAAAPPGPVNTNGAAQSSSHLPQPSFTTVVLPAITASIGGARTSDRSGKRPLAWVVDILRVLDTHSGHDAGVAVATWRAFADSDAWRFKGANPTAWATALGDWLANGRARDPAERANGHGPPRNGQPSEVIDWGWGTTPAVEMPSEVA